MRPLLYVTTQDVGPPAVGYLFEQTSDSLAGCLRILIESRQEGLSWKLLKVSFAGGVLHKKSIESWPVRLRVKQTPRKKWAWDAYQQTMNVAQHAEYNNGLQYKDDGFYPASNATSIEFADLIVRNLHILSLFSYWKNSGMSWHEKLYQLKVDLSLKFGATDRNIGAIISQLEIRTHEG